MDCQVSESLHPGALRHLRLIHPGSCVMKFLLFSYVPKMAAVVRPALLLNKASRGQCNDASACVTPCITSLALLILNRSDCRPMSPLWAHYGNLVKKDYRALDHYSPVEFCVPIAKWVQLQRPPGALECGALRGSAGRISCVMPSRTPAAGRNRTACSTP